MEIRGTAVVAEFARHWR